MKQKWTELKGETDSSIIIFGYFNTPLSITDRITKQKVNKEIGNLNNTMNQLELTEIYILLHPTTAEYAFFSSTHGKCFRIDHILHSKTINFKD